MLVVDNELRILESVVYADEVFDAVRLHLAEPVFFDDVENLSGSFVISWIGGLSQLATGAIQLPEDSLYDDTQKTREPEAGDGEQSFDGQRPPERHLAMQSNHVD